jgi:hypothetical protein
MKTYRTNLIKKAAQEAEQSKQNAEQPTEKQ